MKADVMEKVAALVIAAFGLVAALAWNGAIQAIFVAIFGDASNIAAMVINAVVVTIIAVMVTVWVSKKVPEKK